MKLRQRRPLSASPLQLLGIALLLSAWGDGWSPHVRTVITLVAYALVIWGAA